MVRPSAVGNRRRFGLLMAARKLFCMRGRDQRRAAGAMAISLVLNGLFLAAMVLGVRAVKPPSEPPPIEIRLLPALVQPPPVKAPPAPPRAPQHAAPRPILQPRPLTLPSPLPPVIAPAQPGPAVPPVASGDGAARKGLLPSLTGRAGCDDPASFHLTDAQRVVCDQHMAELVRTAKPLALNMDLDKKADLDRKAKCQAMGKSGGGMPATGSLNESTGSQITGLGYNPSFRECGPGDR
jgi:hypothetical protein